MNDFYTAVFAIERNLACPAFGLDPNAQVKWEPLINELETDLGRNPEIYALVAYDALWLATLTYQVTGLNEGIPELKAAFTKQADNYFGVTGWTTLNEAGDRAEATYDFWGIRLFLNAPEWYILARYNNATKTLVRY